MVPKLKYIIMHGVNNIKTNSGNTHNLTHTHTITINFEETKFGSY